MQPPNEPPPYQPSQQSPIPSPYTPPPGGAVPPQGPAQVNFDVISRAWEVLKPNMGVWVGAFVIYLVIVFAISFISSLLSGAGNTPMPMPVPGSNDLPPAVGMANWPLQIALQLVQFVIIQFLMGGLYRMAINNVRTGTANFGDMFSVADVLPSLLGASILTAIATGIGFLFCIVPGILLYGLLLFTLPLVVDKHMGAIDAMKTSIDTLKPQMGMAVVFAIVMGLLASVGFCLCGVGILVTGPLATLSLAMLYRDFFPDRALA